MTKRLNAKKKISRKLGVNLWGNDKDPFVKRNYRPGQHGTAPKGRSTDYGNQLRAKQMMKFYYNLTERQFKKTFAEASRMRGDVSENFIGMLESRIDTIVYRTNFVSTIFAARQFVTHKHIKINGITVNIPSYRLKPGDVVQIRDKSQTLNIVMQSLQDMKRDVPAYLQLDLNAKSVKLVTRPSFAEVPYPVKMEPHLITEFYSR